MASDERVVAAWASPAEGPGWTKVAALGGLFLVSAASAQSPIPAEQWTQETKRTLAQAMVGEADWHTPDHVALAWVLAKRWDLYRRNRKPIEFSAYIRMYSAPLKTRSRRARWVQSLPWAPLPNLRYRQRWERVRTTVRKWGAGRLSDPCPRALHWGGTMDQPQGHWFPVNCGRTRNIFYGIRRNNKKET